MKMPGRKAGHFFIVRQQKRGGGHINRELDDVAPDAVTSSRDH